MPHLSLALTEISHASVLWVIASVLGLNALCTSLGLLAVCTSRNEMTYCDRHHDVQAVIKEESK